MLFTETSEISIGHIQSLIGYFIVLQNKEYKLLFLVHTKDDQPKYQAVKSAANTG